MYQVLARKYRPRNFNELVGQNHVSRALTSALERGRLHHAYLFTGTRGVGKTTIARILAKCLNCETGVTSTPCETCATCRAVNEGRFIDLIEIDAASRTKVEDTRELLDNVPYAPTQGRFKVYLIDEVHMLSTHSFNALLKTLEEPPEHVKFLFATTDPQKLPITVISRCLQFTLRPLAVDEITTHLTDILNQEEIEADKDAIWQIAESAQGSLRDALSLTDQAIAYGQGQVHHQDVKEMLGLIDRTIIHDLILAIQQNRRAQISQLLLQFRKQALDVALVLDQLISMLHELALLQHLPELSLKYSDEINQKILKLAALVSDQDIQLYYQIACKGRADLALAVTLEQGFEMCILRLLAFRPLGPDETLLVSESLPDTNFKPQSDQHTQLNGEAIAIQKALPEATVSDEVRPFQEQSIQEQNLQDQNLQHQNFQAHNIETQSVEDHQLTDSQNESDLFNDTEIPLAKQNLGNTSENEQAVTEDIADDPDSDLALRHSASAADSNPNSHVNSQANTDEQVIIFDAQAENLMAFDDQTSTGQTEVSLELYDLDNLHEALQPENLKSENLQLEDFQIKTLQPETGATALAQADVQAANLQQTDLEQSRPQAQTNAQVQAESSSTNVLSDSQQVVDVTADNQDRSDLADVNAQDLQLPQQILALQEQKLEGEWTLEKWEYWFRTSELSPAIQELVQRGIMTGQINGVCKFSISPDYEGMITPLWAIFESELKKRWPLTHLSITYTALDETTPYQLQAKRKRQAFERAEQLLAKHPAIHALIEGFDAKLENIQLKS